MTAKPPRATTKGDVKRPRPRGATHGDKAERPERAERASKARSQSVISTDQFVRISDDEIVEETELPSLPPLPDLPDLRDPRDVPQLRLIVLEAAAHLAAAQGAVAAAGHVVVSAASGPAGLAKLRGAVATVDAVLVALPGGEPMIEAALACGAARPIVIAASTAGAVEAARRAAAVGADLAAVRPHDVERLAPILLAAARLVEQRRQLAAPRGAEPAGASGAFGASATGMLDGLGGLDELGDLDDLDGPSERDAGALQPYDVFQDAVEHELARAQRYAYPLAVALFAVDIAPPEPPPGVRGILRARAGNALVHALRDVDRVTELAQDRFLVLLPYTDRVVGAEVARRIISAVAAADPVIAAGRAFPAKVIGAVTGPGPGAPASFAQLLQDATQLLEQASVTGASLAVES